MRGGEPGDEIFAGAGGNGWLWFADACDTMGGGGGNVASIVLWLLFRFDGMGLVNVVVVPLLVIGFGGGGGRSAVPFTFGDVTFFSVCDE